MVSEIKRSDFHVCLKRNEGTTLFTSLLPHVHEGIGIAFWSMSKRFLQMKRSIFRYRTITLLNQKHAVRFKMSTSLRCPVCQQMLSIFSQGVDVQSSWV